MSNANIANPVFTPSSAGEYNFTVTGTNEFGCTATATVTITVIEVRNGQNANQILVCHKGAAIYLSKNAVKAHLAHGCTLGGCVSQFVQASGRFAATTDETNVKISLGSFSFNCVSKSCNG